MQVTKETKIGCQCLVRKGIKRIFSPLWFPMDTFWAILSATRVAWVAIVDYWLFAISAEWYREDTLESNSPFELCSGDSMVPHYKKQGKRPAVPNARCKSIATWIILYSKVGMTVFSPSEFITSSAIAVCISEPAARNSTGLVGSSLVFLAGAILLGCIPLFMGKVDG